MAARVKTNTNPAVSRIGLLRRMPHHRRPREEIKVAQGLCLNVLVFFRHIFFSFSTPNKVENLKHFSLLPESEGEGDGHF